MSSLLQLDLIEKYTRLEDLEEQSEHLWKRANDMIQRLNNGRQLHHWMKQDEL